MKNSTSSQVELPAASTAYRDLLLDLLRGDTLNAAQRINQMGSAFSATLVFRELISHASDHRSLIDPSDIQKVADQLDQAAGLKKVGFKAAMESVGHVGEYPELDEA